MPELGWLMMGTDSSDPYGPGFVIVNVAPATSSGCNECERARAARSAMARAIPGTFMASTLRITGTMRPWS